MSLIHSRCANLTLGSTCFRVCCSQHERDPASSSCNGIWSLLAFEPSLFLVTGIGNGERTGAPSAYAACAFCKTGYQVALVAHNGDVLQRLADEMHREFVCTQCALLYDELQC
ncbi:hypothetical protein EXIGLDRAFT_779106 [Exidia glandulosa HHB12029]|uniref:Uncharacterized protein n=1 Tax=Exidia glandulosa HHB12029 TaxID=1314781 RepID=A0A165C868_EXIGL|nr:hypothetical protein EXIGLDRAFT_779106 [Exidia glandulosa HHB12029]